jgi:glycosyltransferase involved in cell wall biosynthesis
VADGPNQAAFLEQRLGLGPGTAALVPLGFDPAVFGPNEADGRREREARGWSDELIVAVTGKLHAGKRVDLTAKACEQLAGERPIRLVLAGLLEDGVLGSITAAAPTLVDDGRLSVLPMVPAPALASLYRASDVVVFARLSTISIYEAAGTGARVVVGQDRLSNWLAGLHRGIVSVRPDEIAGALERPPDRLQLAIEARAAFAWSVVSEDFCDRYHRIQRRVL